MLLATVPTQPTIIPNKTMMVAPHFQVLKNLQLIFPQTQTREFTAQRRIKFLEAMTTMTKGEPMSHSMSITCPPKATTKHLGTIQTRMTSFIMMGTVTIFITEIIHTTSTLLIKKNIHSLYNP